MDGQSHDKQTDEHWRCYWCKALVPVGKHCPVCFVNRIRSEEVRETAEFFQYLEMK